MRILLRGKLKNRSLDPSFTSLVHLVELRCLVKIVSFVSIAFFSLGRPEPSVRGLKGLAGGRLGAQFINLDAYKCCSGDIVGADEVVQDGHSAADTALVRLANARPVGL